MRRRIAARALVSRCVNHSANRTRRIVPAGQRHSGALGHARPRSTGDDGSIGWRARVTSGGRGPPFSSSEGQQSGGVGSEYPCALSAGIESGVVNTQGARTPHRVRREAALRSGNSTAVTRTAARPVDRYIRVDSVRAPVPTAAVTR